MPSYSAYEIPIELRYSEFKGIRFPSGQLSWLKAMTVISSRSAKSPNTATPGSPTGKVNAKLVTVSPV